MHVAEKERLRNLRSATLLSAAMSLAFIRSIIFAALTTAPLATFAQGAPATPDENVSYSLGLLNGERLRHDGITNEISVESMARGMRDGLAGKSTTPEQKQLLAAFYRSLNESLLARNHAAARDFLARNGKMKGVITTASGLQYSVERGGDLKAATPKPTDRVIIQYRGTLLDATEFDSSYERGQPTSFQVAGVIKGLQEGLALMRPGAKWRFFIPPELAYGDQPTASIPPGSMLIFEVELRSIAAPAAPPGAAPPH
jgi:FKBP-type peptidyl-prolyl cis-trans isomerase